ncbi:MAG: hypothetical protein UX87_C0002G0043 [Candidatus Amesbacteria bacterium GW2011_GWA1_47_16]|uniref:DUF948 domain-containing protein n=5 Tax=Candidatus Amesiibacteriota TaxID=1752730 RepID=A0A1F4ZVY6_9BACT|nr:MAG: hypothetical protein UX87_C0002G0043 [Candidatus Amesbacteria bacterium GW2011_GWA1_47_16]KKU65158.1 MAG: hypothetical protein UX86_C0001G0014 [Candidatus Amesbacteria bacterium GW2011_GWC1_47_15]KKU98482.1 MAG: hypothetical protein UY28_C0001G0032 [Candidatus Amesbacteria bacterium GW2011_GWB1_48_13]OGD00303.1 MAG: hypothetical protein A2972_00650 [Candidatus Amesbacteria bacterium RIFCSPLOWO2_01_FULL_47_33]OGD00875.1 MAG: hypothetical protein A2701_00490 [Candidatus Amesbacteria bacte
MAVFIQLLLGIVVLTLSFLIAFAGIQVFHILHEFRLTLKKLNRILDHTTSLSEAAARPVTAVNEFYTEVKDLVNVTQDQIVAATPDRVITPRTAHRSPRRFFRRSGASLRPS